MTSKANLKGDNSIFSKRLKAIMDERRIAQDELAALLGVKRQTISLYIKGQALPPLDKYMMIADYFGVSCDYLLGRSDVSSMSEMVKILHEFTELHEDSLKKLPDLNISIADMADYTGLAPDSIKALGDNLSFHLEPLKLHWVLDNMINNEEFMPCLISIHSYAYSLLYNKEIIDEAINISEELLSNIEEKRAGHLTNDLSMIERTYNTSIKRADEFEAMRSRCISTFDRYLCSLINELQSTMDSLHSDLSKKVDALRQKYNYSVEPVNYVKIIKKTEG